MDLTSISRGHHNLKTCVKVLPIMSAKSFYSLLFFLLIILSLSANSSEVQPARSVDSVSLEEFLDDSELWSFHVKVDPERIAPELRMAASFPAILLRVEGGKALVDFGRDGVHQIPIEHTNLLEAAVRIKSGEAELDLPNFTRYTTNIFIRRNDKGNYRPYAIDLYASTPHYMIVYGDARLVEDEAIYEGVERLFETVVSKGGLGLTMPTSHSFYAPAMAKGVDWMMPFAHSRIAFVDALYHHPDKEALTLVYVDAYGRVIERAVYAYENAAEGLAAMEQRMASRDYAEPEPVPVFD